MRTPAFTELTSMPLKLERDLGMYESHIDALCCRHGSKVKYPICPT